MKLDTTFTSSEENHMQFFVQVVVDVVVDQVDISAKASGTVVIPFPGGRSGNSLGDFSDAETSENSGNTSDGDCSGKLNL